jgi:hypothetical protein
MSIFRSIFRRKRSSIPPGAEAPKCPQCSGASLKRVLATHPVPLTGRLAGRRVDVYRVEMDKCRHCGTLTPTAEGLAKIERCTKTGIEFFLEHLPKASPSPRKQRAPTGKPPRSAAQGRRKPKPSH